jgi:hypothetical protein
MQVNLKQSEIEQALRLYIAAKGIGLDNKKVTMSFTAGRKATGVSAEVNIEDLTAEVPVRVDPVVYVPDTKAAEPTVVHEELKEEVRDPEPPAVAVEGEVVTVKTVNSLFS